jgi:triosephosphate isomerase
MARRKLIAGNWKMNGSLAALSELDAIAAAAAHHTILDVAICPPFTLIAAAASRAPMLMLGAQDCNMNAKGAHTGCISVQMLHEAGAHYVIVGHSERRAECHETDADVRAKAEACIAGGLVAIVCVGESEAERDAERAVDTVEQQLAGSIPSGATGANLVVAYEPRWAIGTGRTPQPHEISEIHATIRAALLTLIGEAATDVRILYGGSVTGQNAAELLAIANVDGVLVGGASLTAAQFVPIIEAAAAA